MTIAEECVLNCYNPIAVLNEEHNVILVQHIHTKDVFVMKKLTVYNKAVFEALQKNHVHGTPEIFEVIEDNGILTIIEEYISGQTLRSILDNGNSFSREQTIDVVSQLCTILREMHNFSPAIVHRDVKPSNIIITADYDVKLLDMNAAKYISENTSQDTALLGTVGYAAPEQYGFGASGVQADIYSLGRVMNEMLSGNAKEDTNYSPLDAIIKKCTKMDPNDRYASVDELLKELNPTLFSCHQENESILEKYMIPGFRSRNPQNIAIAVIGYFSLFSIGLTLTIQNIKSPSFIWLERSFLILIGLSLTFFTCNYLNVWKLFKIDTIKRPLLKAFTIIILDLCIALLLFIIMLLIES